MNRDDPIALLRALDPADTKEVETLVATLAAAGGSERLVARRGSPAPSVRRSGRRRLALVAVAAAVAALVVTALANPFSRGGGISSAQAKAQVAHALDIQGAWHIGRVTQGANVKGSAAPRFKPGYAEEAWHAPDGRLLIRGSDGSGDSDTTLYANGERREYNSSANRLRVHRFVLAADMRDEERLLLPATAADLYRAAYRVGKVRLAGIETLNGRRVYRLAFDWRGSSYTLIFDAKRQVPISSESRYHEGGNRAFVMRVRYTAYERLQPGPALERLLALPPIPRDAKVVQDHAIVIPAPVQGAPARRVIRSIAPEPGAFPPTASPARATYGVVRRLPDGTILAIALVPNRTASHYKNCFVVLGIAHPGGEARLYDRSCAGQFGMTASGGVMIVGGSTDARRTELRFAGGTVIRAQQRGGVFLAAIPAKLSQKGFSLVSTKQDGKVVSRPWPVFPVGEFTSAFNR